MIGVDTDAVRQYSWANRRGSLIVLPAVPLAWMILPTWPARTSTGNENGINNGSGGNVGAQGEPWSGQSCLFVAKYICAPKFSITFV